MRAVRCRNHKACLTHVPEPAGEGVRVRVAAAGICGSDLHMIAMGFPNPFTLGHEISGITDNGTPVAIEPIAACGHCPCCARVEYNLCVLGAIGYLYSTGGAVAVDSLRAMTLRTGVWLVLFLALAWLRTRCSRRESSEPTSSPFSV